MSDFDDLELDQSPGASPDAPAPPSDDGPPRGGRSTPWIIGAVLLLIALAVASWYVWLRPDPEPALQEPAEPTATRPDPAPAAPAAPEIELPPLGASDEVVRGLVGELSSHPRLAAWLASDELVRKFVATVDNVARGVSPRPHLRAAAPEEAFSVLGEGEPGEGRSGPVTIDPRSYDRYDPLVAAFTGLDPEGTAETYRRLEPLVDAAYRELGYPDREFDRTLEQAIAELLAVPVVDGPVELKPAVGRYQYADPRLEELTPAQKHLLRTGPDNVRRVQNHLRALAAVMGLEPQS